MCGVFMPATALLLLHINLFSYFCIFLIAERTVCETRVQSEIRYKKKHNRKQMNREKSSLHSLGRRGSPGGGQRLPRVRARATWAELSRLNFGAETRGVHLLGGSSSNARNLNNSSSFNHYSSSHLSCGNRLTQ